MNKEYPLLTILTPTYNRAKLLPRLYDSLRRQTNERFQWLIIDDGSTDETKTVVKKFQADNRFEIDYYYKSNGGKHTALNYSHPYIKGEYLVIVDSDDGLIPTAVETILDFWKKYANNESVEMITFQRGGENTQIALDRGIKGEYISDLVTELNRGMSGDHCETIRTDCFCKFKFPEFKGERFIPELAMWYLTTKGKKVVYSDKVIYLCEYLAGGLTRSGRSLHMKNPNGCMWHAAALLGEKNLRLKIRIKKALLVVCYGREAGKNFREILQLANGQDWLVRIMYIPGMFLREYWRNRG